MMKYDLERLVERLGPATKPVVGLVLPVYERENLTYRGAFAGVRLSRRALQRVRSPGDSDS